MRGGHRALPRFLCAKSTLCVDGTLRKEAAWKRGFIG